MYTLQSALGKSLSGGQQWSAIDLSGMTFATVVENYSVVYAVLTNPFLAGPVSLNLNSILPTITNQQQTFGAYLASLGNKALPTSTSIPSIKTQYARYQDGVKAGYTIQPIGTTQSLQYGATIANKPDVLLTRANTNYTTFYQSCLVSINGFFHMTDTDGKTGVWVTNGMASCVKSKKNKLGILNFQDLGKLTMIPITGDMIYKQNTSQALKNRAYLNVGKDLSNSTVMVVIGGYLHILDGKTFKLVGKQSLMIDFNNYPLFERYYESKDFIDLSTLAFTAYPTNAQAVAVDEITSDAAIKALLTLSQSFIVLLDNTQISVQLEKVRAAKIPGQYVSYVEPIWPLITGYGKVNEYWSVQDAGQWALYVEDNIQPNYVFNTVDTSRKQETITDQRDPMRPTRVSLGHYLQISCDVSFS
jgi:hypothetical protein